MRVLSIDGGGIRGILPARVLAELEKLGKRPIAQQFDLLAGTSSGAILALALSLSDTAGRPRYTAAELYDFYLAHGQDLFPGPSLPRRLVRLAEPGRANDARRLLAECFGDARFGDAQPQVIVPTFDLERAVPLLLRSDEFAGHSRPKTSDVALASCAAPTHLPPVEIELGSRVWFLAHGGLTANNPALFAFAAALSRADPNEVVVLSLGTGARPSRGQTGRYYRQLRRWPLSTTKSFGAHMDISSEAQHQMLDAMLTVTGRRDRYWRIQTALDPPANRAQTSDTAATLAALAGEMVDAHQGELEAVSEVLA